MLSYQFIIDDKLPVKSDFPELQKALQDGRNHLINARFPDALQCFDKIAAAPEVKERPDLRCWAHMLRGYTRLTLANYLPDKAEEIQAVAHIDFKSATLLDLQLGTTECEELNYAGNVMEQLFVSIRQQKDKIHFPKIGVVAATDEYSKIVYATALLQAWTTQRIRKQLNTNKNIKELIKEIDRNLEDMPTNHILRSLKYLALLKVGCNYAEINKVCDLTIDLCPKIEAAHAYLSVYYFNRGQMSLGELRCTKDQRKLDGLRSTTISDFQEFFILDNANVKRDQRFKTDRIHMFSVISGSYYIPKTADINDKQKRELRRGILNIQSVNYTPTSADFVKLAQQYTTIKELEMVKLAYHNALWLINVNIDPKPPAYVKEINDRITALSNNTEYKAPTKIKKSPIPEYIPDKKAEAKKIVDEIIKNLVTESVKLGDLALAEAKQKQDGLLKQQPITTKINRQKRKKDAKKARLLEEHKPENFIPKMIAAIASDAAEIGLTRAKKRKTMLAQLIKVAIEKRHEREQTEQDKQNYLSIIQKIPLLVESAKKQKQKHKQQLTTSFEHLNLKAIETHIRLEEIARREQQERDILRQKELEARYYQQETIPFEAITTVQMPKLVMQLLNEIRALPGRAAKRTDLYGGKARETLLTSVKLKNVETQPDYDVETGASYIMVAPILKKVFNLTEEPKETHGILKITFPIQNEKKEQEATLSVMHKPILEQEDLSYVEVLQRVSLTFDFKQNGFVAIPKDDLNCSVYYPLNFWDVYLAEKLDGPDGAESNIQKAREKIHLSETLIKISRPVLVLIKQDNIARVFFYIYGHAEKDLAITVKWRTINQNLLLTDEFGRLIMTPQNQAWMLDLIARAEQSYQAVRPKLLRSLQHDIVKRISHTMYIETILESDFALSSNPLLMLRVVYQTPPFGYKNFDPKLIEAIKNNKDAYKQYLSNNPVRINSWMNKILCQEGKPYLVQNFYNLKLLGILQLSFPNLAEVLDEREDLRQWLEEKILTPASAMDYPSLDFLYSAFIVCLIVKTEKESADIIMSNALFRKEFKGNTPPQAFFMRAQSSWLKSLKSFQSSQNTTTTPPLKPPPVNQAEVPTVYTRKLKYGTTSSE